MEEGKRGKGRKVQYTYHKGVAKAGGDDALGKLRLALLQRQLYAKRDRGGASYVADDIHR